MSAHRSSVASFAPTLLAASFVLAACGPAAVAPRDGGELEGMHVERRGGIVVAQDAGELFREGNRLYDRARFGEAAAHYDRILELSPAADLRRRALFNAGLAHEGAGDHLRAAERYRALLAETEEGRARVDAAFRLGQVEEKREQWIEAERAWDLALAEELTLPDKAEAHFHRGWTRERQERLAEAERDYRAAVRVYERNRSHPRLRSLAAVSRAQYQIGEIYGALFSRIAFRLPLATMERAWVEKATLFLKAQHAYLAVVRLPNEHWAVAAGHQLGSLYERMYFDMLAAEVPPDLDETDREVYQEELAREIRPYVERAVEIYEKNLEISERLGHEGEWVQKSRERLITLRELLQ